MKDFLQYKERKHALMSFRYDKTFQKTKDPVTKELLMKFRDTKGFLAHFQNTVKDVINMLEI